MVGHDWGGIVAWQMALLAPHRVARVVGVNTPFFPRLPMRPTALMRAMAQGNFHYVLYFQEPGVAEAELDARRAAHAARLHAAPDRARLEELLAAGPQALGPPTGGLLDRLPDAPHGDFLTADGLRGLRRRLRAAPAFAAASTGTATSTATGRPPPTSPAPRCSSRR